MSYNYYNNDPNQMPAAGITMPGAGYGGPSPGGFAGGPPTPGYGAPPMGGPGYGGGPPASPGYGGGPAGSPGYGGHPAPSPGYGAAPAPYGGQQLHGAPPGGQPFRTTFGCVSLNESDRLRMIRFPQPEVQAVRAAIKKAWPKGIQDERDYHGSHEFKIKGNPWEGQGNEAVPSRHLTCCVLEALWDMGWILVAATDISKKQLDKDTLYFRHQSPPPPRCQWFAISFNREDRLRLIGAPQDLIDPFKQVLGHNIQKSEHLKEGAFEFKIKGYPWNASGGEAVTTRTMLLSVLETLEAHGFTLYTSFDQNTGTGGDKGSGETDTWFLRRTVGWVRGQPVLH